MGTKDNRSARDSVYAKLRVAYRDNIVTCIHVIYVIYIYWHYFYFFVVFTSMHVAVVLSKRDMELYRHTFMPYVCPKVQLPM